MQHHRQVSRADLLACLRVYGAERTTAWAQALGYTPEEPQPPTLAPPAPVAAPVAPVPQTPTVPETRPQLRLPRLVHYEPCSVAPETLQEPAWYQKVEPWKADDPDLSANPQVSPLPQLPLMPWSRLWPFLKAVLSVRLESAQLDVPPLVERLARGDMPPRLPRRRQQSWASTCQVLMDFADALTPFWDDFHWLRQRLTPWRGAQGLTVLAFPDGNPEGPCLVWSPAQREWLAREAYTLPVAGTPVLVLSDLGCNDATGVRRRPWQRLGVRLCRAGCQPVALMPCPPRHWDGAVTHLFAPVYWDRGARRPQRPWPYRGQPAARSPQPWEADAEALLQALGAAVRIEPALLRAVRYLLPGTDVGSEAAAWNHPHLHTTPLGMYYEPAVVAMYRQAFKQQLDPGLRQEVAGLLKAYHAHLSPVIIHEEQWLLETSGSVPSDEKHEIFQARLVHNLRDQEGDFVAAVRAWVQRMARRQYAASWQSERLVATWVATHLAQIQAGDMPEVPQGLDLDKAGWLLTGNTAPQHYTIRQRGRSLSIETEPSASPLDAPGSPLGRLSTARPFVRVQYPDRPETLHALQQSLRLPSEGGLRLRTEYQEVRLESLPRPAWASGIGQDQHGLFVTWAARQRKAYWVPPGVYAVTDRAGQLLGQRSLEGFWCDVVEALELLQDGFRQPLWAEAYGLDTYGLYADWRVHGVTQRLRWIAPGTFMMGSPETEPDRLSNETLHRVVLTRGFWLAETTCTQALWRAVMGANPSDFQGEDRPVENVSWNDVQTFLQRLNGLLPAGEVRLPTEAEWEYACRAGTTTPFWFGEQITPEQVNYGVPHNGTVPVKALPCNAWGLYQMHGNVWEWCQDWYGPYTAEAADVSTDIAADTAESSAVDPVGAAAGVDRVLRGGSWISDARLARAARRYAYRPGFRYAGFGVRLARGQASPAGGAPEAQGAAGIRRAGQTARSRVGQARRAPRQRSTK